MDENEAHLIALLFIGTILLGGETSKLCAYYGPVLDRRMLSAVH